MEGVPGPPFLRRFCTDPMPEIEAVSVADGTLYELAAGPVGNTAACSAVFGFYSRADVLVHQSPGDEFAEHFVLLTTPCEVAQLDVFVHKDLPFELPPEALVRSRMELGLTLPPEAWRRYRLPITGPVHELGTGLAPAASPHVPGYLGMIESVHERAGWSADDFRGYRFELRYPPIPTIPTLRYPLLTPPGE